MFHRTAQRNRKVPVQQNTHFTPGRGKRCPAEYLSDRSFCWARKTLQCPAVHRVKGFSRPFFERRPMAPLETQSLQKLFISVQQPCDESYITMTASSISGETLTKPLSDLPIYSRFVAVAARDEKQELPQSRRGTKPRFAACVLRRSSRTRCAAGKGSRWRGGWMANGSLRRIKSR